MYLVLLKRLWPYLAGLLLLWAVYGWHKSQVKAAFDQGVRETEERQAQVIAERMFENEKRERALALLVQAKQIELEGKSREIDLLTTSVDDLLARKRVCLTDEVRSRPVPSPSAASGDGNGTAEGDAIVETVGRVATELFAEGQRSTDKLIALQEYVKALHEGRSP